MSKPWGWRIRGRDLIFRALLVLAAVDIAVVDIWYQALRTGGKVASGPNDYRAAYLTALWGCAVIAALAAAILPGFRLRTAAAAGAGTVAFVWGVLGGLSIGLFLLPAAMLALVSVLIEDTGRGPEVVTAPIWTVTAMAIAVAASAGALALP